MFGINLKSFLAQLVNFAIVLFVLWKWVFRPVAQGLADRTAKIEKSLDDAQQITVDKQTFETWKNAEISKVRQEAATIISGQRTKRKYLKNKCLYKLRVRKKKL